MTGLELALAAGAALAGAAAAFQSWRLRRLLTAARNVAARLEEVRAALEFVSEGHAFPHASQFAAAILDGNDVALRQAFPAWHIYREQSRETEWSA